MKALFLILFSSVILSGCASTATKPSQVERITPEDLAKLIPPPVARITLNEIVADSKTGKTPDDMIAKIKASNSRYDLTPAQVIDLNKQGVDVKVLDYIQQSNELAKQNAIADEMNKREKEKRVVQQQLRRERDFARNQFYDPFWGPQFGAYYGRPYYGLPRPGIGWGLNYGYPFYW